MPTRMSLSTEAANSLTLAIILSTDAPVLLLDGDLRVVAASTSFCGTFRFDPESLPGRQMSELGTGEWHVPQLDALLKATVSGYATIDAYEMDLTAEGRPPQKLVVNARRLDYGDAANVRVLLTASDVTATRRADKLKDDLLREKAILLQELQHRVANSLQIIASVLMLSAKRVQSEETRSHLYQAHERVMSVAAMQNHLAPSRLGNVELRPYFTDLCRTIGASMIRDHDQVSLCVSADDSVTTADISISLGLIVTELVINALKHAFPGQRKGHIVVDYRADGPSWALSVSDDGIGLKAQEHSQKAGLGTSIVEALVKQLDANIRHMDATPGTKVLVTHTEQTLQKILAHS